MIDIWRYTQNAIVIFDEDDGIATAIDEFLSESSSYRIINMTKVGQDDNVLLLYIDLNEDVDKGDI